MADAGASEPLVVLSATTYDIGIPNAWIAAYSDHDLARRHIAILGAIRPTTPRDYPDMAAMIFGSHGWSATEIDADAPTFRRSDGQICVGAWEVGDCSMDMGWSDLHSARNIPDLRGVDSDEERITVWNEAHARFNAMDPADFWEEYGLLDDPPESHCDELLMPNAFHELPLNPETIPQAYLDFIRNFDNLQDDYELPDGLYERTRVPAGPHNPNVMVRVRPQGPQGPQGPQELCEEEPSAQPEEAGFPSLSEAFP